MEDGRGAEGEGEDRTTGALGRVRPDGERGGVICRVAGVLERGGAKDFGTEGVGRTTGALGRVRPEDVRGADIRGADIRGLGVLGREEGMDRGVDIRGAAILGREGAAIRPERPDGVPPRRLLFSPPA